MQLRVAGPRKERIMLRIELSREEQELLTYTLHSALDTLDVELHRTDKLETKHFLKRRRELMGQLLTKVQAPQEALV